MKSLLSSSFILQLHSSSVMPNVSNEDQTNSILSLKTNQLCILSLRSNTILRIPNDLSSLDYAQRELKETALSCLSNPLNRPDFITSKYIPTNLKTKEDVAKRHNEGACIDLALTTKFAQGRG